MRDEIERRRGRTFAAMGLIATAVVIVDLVVKSLMTTWLGPDASSHAWWLVEGQVGFEYIQNSGVAFGFLQGYPRLVGVVAVVAGAGYIWFIMHELDGVHAAIGGGLMAGGAIGNLVERFGIGYVTDYVALGAWPRFNVADSAVTVALVYVVIRVVLADQGPTGAKAPAETIEVDRDRQI